MPFSLPAIRYLLAIGVRHVRDLRGYGWLYVANAALNLLDTALPAPAPRLVISLAGGVVLLVATRRILTGAASVGGRDVVAILRLLWLYFVLILPAVIPFAVVALLFGDVPLTSFTGAVPFLVAIYFLARGSFLAPALAIGDATGLRTSFEQTRALWPLLLALAAIAGTASALIGLVLPALGLASAVRDVMAGFASAATLLVAQASICWLYARVTGRDASAIAR